jgi:hypothetical protein
MADNEKTPETVQDPAVLNAATPVTKPTLTAEEILDQVVTYRGNADQTLAKIQESIDKVTEQLNNLQRMRIMIMGQKELLSELFKKATATPTESK